MCNNHHVLEGKISRWWMNWATNGYMLREFTVWAGSLLSATKSSAYAGCRSVSNVSSMQGGFRCSGAIGPYGSWASVWSQFFLFEAGEHLGAHAISQRFIGFCRVELAVRFIPRTISQSGCSRNSCSAMIEEASCCKMFCGRSPGHKSGLRKLRWSSNRWLQWHD